MRKATKFLNRKTISIIIIIAAAIFGYFTQEKETDETVKLSDKAMRVHFIDVGEGDSTFIEFPDGKTMLVDAGERDQGETVAQYIEKLGTEKIDFLVGTHPHSDHIGGLETVIRNLEIGSVYMPKATHNTATFENLLLAIKEKGLSVKTAKAGVVIYESDGITVEVLSPTKDKYDNLNNYSAVVYITYNDTSFLLTGDAENEILNQPSVGVKADVLKVPHHGSDTSGSSIFLKRVSPEYAVIPVGTPNQYGHPHREVIELLEKNKIEYLRTDEEGTVVFESDGKSVKHIESGE